MRVVDERLPGGSVHRHEGVLLDQVACTVNSDIDVLDHIVGLLVCWSRRSGDRLAASQP